jgi:hypothetical protein
MRIDQFPSMESFGEQLDALAERDATRGRGRRPLAWRPAVPSRRLAVVTASLAAVVAVATGTVVGFHDDSPRVSLAERAYADATAPGVVHWRVSIAAYNNGILTTIQHEEGWAQDGVTHTVLLSGAGERSERRIAGDQETYRTGDGPVQSGPAGQTDLDRALPGTDPFNAFRVAHETDRLKQTTADTFAVTPATGPASPTLTYTVDPDDANPESLIEIDGASRTVITFELYEHLPDDAAHRHLLELGAGS